MDDLDKTLLDTFQHQFPLVNKPFLKISEKYHKTESEILDRFQNLVARGFIRRIGPVINTEKLGSSTLAAMSVKENDIDNVVKIINGFDEVNHNYLRTHLYNIWFVINADNEQKLSSVLQSIESQTGYHVLKLPMLKNFHIDLGFSLWN